MPTPPRRALLPPLDPVRYAPTPGRPVRAKARTLEADSEIAPHSHPWAQVAISVSGVARVTAAHATYLVPAWRAVWIPPGIEHVVMAVEKAELRTLYIDQSDGVGPGVPSEAASMATSICITSSRSSGDTSSTRQAAQAARAAAGTPGPTPSDWSM